MSQNAKKIDALVIGAGPAGLTMAAELARYGVSVRIVDRAAQRTDKSKAIVIWSRTLEMFDRMGCTAQFLNEGRKVLAAQITAGAKQIAHFTFDGVATPHPYALVIPQSDTERLMEEHLRSFGVEVERGVELTGFAANQDGVQSNVRYADGREGNIESAWLLGCDGAHSAVRHQLGMEFPGHALTSDWILADIHLKDVPNPDEISIAWHADGVLAIFPIAGSRYRVIADVGDQTTEARRGDPTLQEVQDILDKRGPGGITGFSPVWLAEFRISERKVADYRAGRVFLAGDAAHIHSPAGGQGMNTGMQDACNLAWKLALVCSGAASDGWLLDSYSQERSAVAQQVLEGAGRVTALSIMRSGIGQSIRNHIASLVFGLSPVRTMAANMLSEVSIGYPHSPLSVAGAHLPRRPTPGQRAPIRNGELPVGAGTKPRFVLFGKPDNNGSAPLNERYPHLLEPEIREPFHEEGLWLLRPDGYVALAAKGKDATPVAQFLDRLSME